MRIRKAVTGLALAIALIGCEDNADPTAPAIGITTRQAALLSGVMASATGSGHVKRPDGGIRKFTVNAVTHSDGSVSGHYDLNVGPIQVLKDDGFRPPHLKFKGTITCMTVIGNSAYLGGVVDSHTNGELFFGRSDFTGVAIELIDSGDEAVADQISSVFVYFPDTPGTPQDYCDAPTPGPVFPIDQGNITVR